MKVLILESDKILARNLSLLLERAGHTVCCNVDAQAAIISADKEKPDAIIMDLLLAGRSGAEFLYEFRSYPEWHGIPVYILSSVLPSEAGVDSGCFNKLNVKRFFYKPTTALGDILSSLESATVAAI